jgi:hypothetical protein
VLKGIRLQENEKKNRYTERSGKAERFLYAQNDSYRKNASVKKREVLHFQIHLFRIMQVIRNRGKRKKHFNSLLPPISKFASISSRFGWVLLQYSLFWVLLIFFDLALPLFQISLSQ